MMYDFTNALGDPYQMILARRYNPPIHSRGPKKAVMLSVPCLDRWDIRAADNMGVAI